MSTQATPLTIPASHQDDALAPGEIAIDERTAPDADTAETIRAHLLRTHNRPELLGTTEKP